MEALRSWGTTVCLAALAAGIAGILTPSGKMEKVYKFALSLFMLCCLLLPLFSLNSIKLKNIHFNGESSAVSADLTQTIDKQKEMMAEKNISELVLDCCKSSGVTPVSIKVSLIKDKNNAYSVNAVEVSLKSSDMLKQENIKEIVMKRLSIDIKIKEGGK